MLGFDLIKNVLIVAIGSSIITTALVQKIKEKTWILKKIFGKKYYIVYTDKLKKGEILVYRHKFYIGIR